MSFERRLPFRPPSSSWQQIVTQQATALRFGAIEIVVHAGRVVQIDKTERIRLEQASTKSARPESGGKAQ
jgi:hypothetical protein